MVKAREEFGADTDPGRQANAGKFVASPVSRESRREEVPNRTKERRFYALVELTLIRIREFVREPEALFWSFVFPVLLAVALGIAFRNTAPEKPRIAVESDASATNSAAANAIADALRGSSDLEVTVLSPAAAAQAMRSGKVARVVRATSTGGGETQQNGSTRMSSSSESGVRKGIRAGSALHRLSRAGPDWDELDGHRHVGTRICHCSSARTKTAKEICGHTDAKVPLSTLVHALASNLHGGRGRDGSSFRVDYLWGLRSRIVRKRRHTVSHRSDDIFSTRPTGGSSAENNRRGVGADESCDAADVAALRHILFIGALSANGSTVHQSIAAHSSKRFPARCH